MKTFIFDFFGVICKNPHESWYANHADIKSKLEEYRRDNEYKADLGELDEAEYIKGLADITGISLEDITTELESYHVIDQGVVSFIRSLKPKNKIIVLSDAPKGMVEKIVSENNLGDLFDQVVVSSVVGMIKPSREIFQYVLDSNSLDSSQAIFIDDNPVNIKGAEGLGIRSILYSNLENLKSLIS